MKVDLLSMIHSYFLTGVKLMFLSNHHKGSFFRVENVHFLLQLIYIFYYLI